MGINNISDRYQNCDTSQTSAILINCGEAAQRDDVIKVVARFVLEVENSSATSPRWATCFQGEVAYYSVL